MPVLSWNLPGRGLLASCVALTIRHSLPCDGRSREPQHWHSQWHTPGRKPAKAGTTNDLADAPAKRGGLTTGRRSPMMTFTVARGRWEPFAVAARLYSVSLL